MNSKKLKRNMVISSLLLALTAGGLLRVYDKINIRAVDLLTILACGAAIGVLLVNFVLYLKYKDAKQD